MISEVTLTFDNGPDPVATPLVLDALAARGLKATFFVLGEKLVAAREPAERAVAEGHWIGNHTWSHSAPLGQMSADAARLEITATQDAIGALAHRDRYFRPMGDGGEVGPHLLSRAALDELVTGRFTLVLWDAVPRDWEDPGWVDVALGQCLGRERALLVLHDLPHAAPPRLEEFLDRALDNGVRFVQAFPDACIPLRRGEPAGALDGLVT